jgi:branched-chain amino acid transport system permease protein
MTEWASLFAQQVLNGLVIGSTYAVVAIGFSLVFTVMRVINFAHPDMFMVGMFAGLFTGMYISGNFVVAIIGAAIGSALMGLIVERVVIRPLRGQDILITLIGTVGLSTILQNGAAILVSPDPVPYPHLLPQFPVPVGPVSLSSLQIVNFVVMLVILALVSFYVHRTRYGRATRAIAENADVAAAFGVNVDRISQVTVLLSSLFAGVASVSVGMLYGSAWAFIGLLYGLKSFTCMLVAGNRYFEAVIGVALLLGVLEALVGGFISSSYKDAVAFLVLIAVLYFRPNGLFGSYSV